MFRYFGMVGLFCLGVLFSSVAYTAPLVLKNSDVTFLAVGSPGFLEIEGTDGKLTVGDATIEGSIVKGTLKVKLDDMTTDMDLRDRHMKTKYLETAKYPWAVLKLDPTDLKSGKFSGTLTLKGQTKKVTGKLGVTGGQISASFSISMEDFPAIGVPSWLGVTVADEVQIVVKANL